jgi:hypothetical protein
VPTVSTSQTVAGLGGPWSVTLGEKQLSSPLKSWEEMDAGTFAGTAVYKQEFTVAAALPQDKRVYLDLGDVHETARVQLNGTQLDARPWPPYLWDVTHSIKSGANTLEVEVQKEAGLRPQKPVRPRGPPQPAFRAAPRADRSRVNQPLQSPHRDCSAQCGCWRSNRCLKG